MDQATSLKTGIAVASSVIGIALVVVGWFVVRGGSDIGSMGTDLTRTAEQRASENGFVFGVLVDTVGRVGILFGQLCAFVGAILLLIAAGFVVSLVRARAAPNPDVEVQIDPPRASANR